MSFSIQKRPFILGFIILSLATPGVTHSWSLKSCVASVVNKIRNNPAASICAVALTVFTYRLYSWFRTPVKGQPTLEMLKVKTHAQSLDGSEVVITSCDGINDGIHKARNIVIFCHGYASGIDRVGASSAKAFMRAGYINSAACITFEFNDDRRAFNLGQEYDQHCLDIVYNAVRAKAPNSKIILMGMSRGSLVILNYLGNQRPNQEKFGKLGAVVLFEPVNQTIKEIKNSVFDLGARLIFPNYKPKQHQGITHATSFAASQVPIFVTYIKTDAMVTDIQKTVGALKKLGCSNIYEYVIEQHLMHGKSWSNETLFQVINAFFYKNNLQYDMCALSDSQCVKNINGIVSPYAVKAKNFLAVHDKKFEDSLR